MLFKISFLHERATLRMYTWNFKKLTTRRVALWKRKKFIRPSSTVILKKRRLEGEKYLSIQTLEPLHGLNHKMSFFFLRFIRDNFSTSITFLRYLVLPWQHLFNYVIFFFFHYRENVFSNIIMLFDAMWNHNCSGFRSRSIRDIPLFSQRL